jgi:hypothetical protein
VRALPNNTVTIGMNIDAQLYLPVLFDRLCWIVLGLGIGIGIGFLFHTLV